MRLLAALLIALASSCSTYSDKTSTTEDGTIVKHLFKYGKFCGDGHPVMSIWLTNDGRKEYLLTSPAPVDDLDAACYAHDMCFEVTRNDDTNCDFALIKVLGDAAWKLNAAGDGKCHNLVTLVSSAFMVKPWGVGDDEADTAGTTIINVLFGAPIAAIRGLGLALLQLQGYADEGECNFGDEPSRRQVVSKFVDEYHDNYRVRTGQATYSEISIPIPAHWPD